MSRAALILLAAFAAPLLAQGPGVRPRNPHLDPTVNLSGCPACHAGHGVPNSPMLPGPVRSVCLDCHTARPRVDELIAARVLAQDVRPALLSDVLTAPYQHPTDGDALPQESPRSVRCTSCHAAHRATASAFAGVEPSGQQLPSPKDPRRTEFELCQGCHGDQGIRTADRRDTSRLLNPSNRSFHPVEGPSSERSPSVRPELSGRFVNCTDCHGNDDANGTRGLHGSRVRYLLRDAYATTDGSPDAAAAYALCFRCHSAREVLESRSFPEHRSHVVDLGASCATCHSPHGSIGNRALIRFGEETMTAGVAASASTGKLAFESGGPGFGTCYLTCHGRDHGPEAYGGRPGRTLDRPGPRRAPVVPGSPVPPRRLGEPGRIDRDSP